jgi:hypothetical protein
MAALPMTFACKGDRILVLFLDKRLFHRQGEICDLAHTPSDH